MIGDVIKRYREQKGWTQEQLAEKMGYTSKSTINKIEKNINDVGQRKILKFAEVFGCDVTDLLCDTPVSEESLVERLPDSYTPEQIQRAMSFLEQYERAIPEIQTAVCDLLKVDQSDF